MPITLDVSVDVGNFLSRRLDVTMRVDSDALLPAFRFELVRPRPKITLEDLQIVDVQGNTIDHSIVDGEITFASQRFDINYSVVIGYFDCVGVDRATEFNYPFINASEIFFSTGLFPIPVNLHIANQDMQLIFQVHGVPEGWQVFSSLDVGELTSAKLDNFYWYAAPGRQPSQITVHGREKPIRFQVLSQREKAIPISSNEFSIFIKQFFSWIEKNIAPYRQLPEINFLILQAPPNYKDLTDNSTFATGENVMNGILAYGPNDPAAYRMLGSSTYRDYLYEGLAHEILHLYTTTAVQGRYKSVLYPGPECPPAHARLIGESMNLYFVYEYVGEYLGDPKRLKNQIKYQLDRVQSSTRRNGLLDMYMLDQFLSTRGSSLLKLFSAMVKRKQERQGPYSSGEFIFEITRDILGIDFPVGIKATLLNEEIPLYHSLINL